MEKHQVSIIPQPNNMIITEQVFNFDEDVVFYLDFQDAKSYEVSNYFFEILNIVPHPSKLKDEITTSFMERLFAYVDETFDRIDGEPKEKKVVISDNHPAFKNPEIGDGGYVLDISSDTIYIGAKSSKGLFYAIQTIRQLLPLSIERDKKSCLDEKCSLPGLKVSDFPRFKWRGMHLDVGRHFFSVDEIKKFLDLLAFYKFNNFHWHLTEDQGWRIEIKKWPRLTEFGSCRSESPQKGNRNAGDGIEYCGFYTQEEIKEVVKYAGQLFINVVPEIEIPGHSSAAIASYPQFGNPNGPTEVLTRWGVSDGVYNIKEETFLFLQDVLSEVMDLFPSEFIHIGGDEAPKGPWKNNPDIQDFIQKKGLIDEHGLQSWYIAKIESFLNKNNRRLIGWDEIQEGGLAPNAAMMVWRNWQYGIDAANKGHDIVMSPTSHSYFDYYQGDPENEPEAIGGYLPLKKVYSFDPVPEGLDKNKIDRVLGAQGNLWTEYIYDWDKLMYMAFPRTTAMAEVVWTLPEFKNYDNFLKRWEINSKRLDSVGVNYRNLSDSDF